MMAAQAASLCPRRNDENESAFFGGASAPHSGAVLYRGLPPPVPPPAPGQPRRRKHPITRAPATITATPVTRPEGRA